MADEATERLAQPIEGEGTQTAKPPGFPRALGLNLLAGLEFLAFRRTAAQRVVGSVPQVLALVLIGAAAALANDFWQAGAGGTPNPEGLAGLLFGQPFLLLSAWAVTRLARAESRLPAALVALEALWLPLDLVVIGFTYLPEPLWNRIGGPQSLPFWAVYAWGMAAGCAALIRVAGLGTRRAWAAVLAVGVLLVLPTVFVNPERRLWLPPQYLDEDEASAKARASESVLYGEHDLLEDALDAIQPGRPGVPEFFLVALGGTGSQDVFMREVTEVRSLFDRRFDTQGHSIVLLNNPATLSRYPIASMTALRRTLEVVGQRMNRDEDVLVLFMTSHGAQDFRFELELEPWALDPISPEKLRDALDDAGIRDRVLIVSACYSGGFVEPLADRDTLVMTASRADRNSHGCSHEADWTFFGRAMFAEALEHTRSFEQAFAVASHRIAERETAEGLVHSEPRIAVGERIRRRLEAIEKRLGG